MKLNEKIHISLTIDSDNNTSFDIDPNEDLDILCPIIVKKYNLSQKVQKNLKKYIKNFITEEIEKEKEKKKVLKQKAEASVYRLYTQSVQNEKKKKDCLKKLKEDKMNDLVNKFPFKPKILFNKRYERNYDKIEDKLINDGKKSKEKNALRKIAKEIENRSITKSELKKKIHIGYTSVESLIHNEEKKILNSNESYNPTNQKKNSILYNTSSNHLQNYSNLQLSQLNNNFHQNLVTNSNILQHQNNSNYQILISDENNKSIMKGLENSLTKTNQKSNHLLGANNVNNYNQSQLLRVDNHLNTSINKNSTKAMSILGKNLDISLCKKDSHQTQFNKLNLQNNNANHNNSSSIINQPNTHNNLKYSEQYLKQKNIYSENVYNNTSMHQSSISQKKNESSLNISNQINNNNHDVKTLKDIMLGNRNTTTNQNIESYNSARMITKTISFGNENTKSKDSKEKNKNSLKGNVLNKKIIPFKKNNNQKKNNDSMIVYKFKSDKYNNKKNRNIYENSKELKRAKEEHYQHIISSEYSFRPILTEASREYISRSLNKHESREEFLNRLTNSKKMKNLSLNLKKRKFSIDIKSNQTKSKNCTRRSFSSKSYNVNRFTTTEETETKSYNNVHTVVTNDKDDSNRIREVKQSKELIENIKHQQYKEKILLNNCTEKILSNINSFKLNNLKEVFEIIYNNCSNIDEIQNIENYGISSKIKDKLILPTCHIMKERNLEFNFQNFFLISNEIINFTIDA